MTPTPPTALAGLDRDVLGTAIASALARQAASAVAGDTLVVVVTLPEGRGAPGTPTADAQATPTGTPTGIDTPPSEPTPADPTPTPTPSDPTPSDPTPSDAAPTPTDPTPTPTTGEPTQSPPSEPATPTNDPTTPEPTTPIPDTPASPTSPTPPSPDHDEDLRQDDTQRPAEPQKPAQPETPEKPREQKPPTEPDPPRKPSKPTKPTRPTPKPPTKPTPTRRKPANPPSAPATSKATAVAAGLSGIKYVWGGSSVKGFDCSGFTQYVYRRIGVTLPRTSQQQQRFAKPTNSPRPGDLVFFGSPAHHVGIYAGNGKMYDAPHTGATTGLHKVHSGASYGRVR